MKRDAYIYDGAVKALSLRDPEGWRTVATTPEAGQLDSVRAYATVASVFRCAGLRCSGVQGMPFALKRGQTDITEGDEGRRLATNLRRHLWRIEAALCFYGACYLLPVVNKFRRNPGLQWFIPSSIVPQYNPSAPGGVSWYDRYTIGLSQRYQPDELIAIWLPSLIAEVGPGTPPAQAALGASNVLAGLDAFAAQFFERGAVKATLLTVEGNPPKSEMDKLEAWWKRLIAGVRNAWQTVAIRAGVTPVVIGDGIKELESDKLIAQKREDICAAFGVPISLIQSNASSFATANADRLNFYDLTIIPECRFLEDELNAQYYDRLGLRLCFQPERLELYQEQELQKAEALSKLTGGKPILTVNEARERLELEPLDEEEADRIGSPQPPEPPEPDVPDPEPIAVPDMPDPELDEPDVAELRALLTEIKVLLNEPPYRDPDSPVRAAGDEATDDASGEASAGNDSTTLVETTAPGDTGDPGGTADRPDPASDDVATGDDPAPATDSDGDGLDALVAADGPGLDGPADSAMGDNTGASVGDRPDGDDADPGATDDRSLSGDTRDDAGRPDGDAATGVWGGESGDGGGNGSDADSSGGGESAADVAERERGSDEPDLANEQ